MPRGPAGQAIPAPDFVPCPAPADARVLAWPTTWGDRSCWSSTRRTTRRCAPCSCAATPRTSPPSTTLGAQVLASARRTWPATRRFARANGLRLPLLADTDKAVGERYGILGPLGFYRRSVFVVDAEGVIRFARRSLSNLTYVDADRSGRGRPGRPRSPKPGRRAGIHRRPRAPCYASNECSLSGSIRGCPAAATAPSRATATGSGRWRPAVIDHPGRRSARRAPGRPAGRADRAPGRELRPTSWSSSGSCSRPTPAPPWRSARRAAWPWSPPPRPAARWSSTARTRSSRPSPATARRPRSQVQRMVQILLDLPERPRPPDAADALALAICHLTGAPAARAAIAAQPGGRAPMIGSLRGVLLDRVARPDQSRRGAARGGRRRLPGGRAGRAPWPGSASSGPPAFVHVHTHVREDAIILYGFASRDERACFEALIGTHGVGPAVALAMLSVHSPAALRRAVRHRRRRRPHAGPRHRQEDRRPPADRAQGPARPRSRRAGPGRSSAPAGVDAAGRRGPGSEVRAALAGLGYGHDEVREALAALPDEGTVEELLRCALRQLAGSLRRPPVPAPPGRCGEPAGGAAAGAGRPVAAVADPVEAAEEVSLRPRRLAEFVGQAQLKEHLEIVLEAARRRSQPVDHLLFAGPPGLGKTTLAGIVAAEMGVEPADHLGAGPGAGRRPGRHPHRPGRGRRALHRRDPPAGPGRRGDPVPGDGGLPARHRARQGPGGPLDPARPAPLHPGRRHHPHRADHRPAPRPVRLRRPPRLLQRRPISRRSSAGRPRILGVDLDDGRRRPRSPARSRGTPRIANRLLKRVRDFAEVRGDGTVDRGDRGRRASTLFGVDELGLDKVDRAILRRGLQPLRRRTGRPVDAGGERRRGDRHRRGRVRAVSCCNSGC